MVMPSSVSTTLEFVGLVYTACCIVIWSIAVIFSSYYRLTNTVSHTTLPSTKNTHCLVKWKPKNM